MNKLSAKDKLTQFLLYTGSNGDVRVETYLHKETLWLPQAQIAQLFGVQRPAIGKHLKSIFATFELDEKVVCSILEHTTQHGAITEKIQNTRVKYYNLDAILSVGYRVNSNKATQFRIWANKTLKEYIIKGFAMDDERLKNGKHFGKDYFAELLERVRSIRASERRIYQQITDIFAECCIDYDNKSDFTKQFYAGVQNKFHYAISGQTAAQILTTNANKNLPNMGLQTWKNAPKGRILKSDTTVAKNYLKEDEIKKLERTISAYFDYIENQIENRKALTMKEFSASVDNFLSFNDFKVLDNFGDISKKEADIKATKEYDKFNKTQKINSDFDQIIKRIKNK
ncbi:MAG: virulence RhuM family protein [Candidatus Thioglobus sp.]|nr:virulence RhuM family protein [Candidatus Thioglobus sp.]